MARMLLDRLFMHRSVLHLSANLALDLWSGSVPIVLDGNMNGGSFQLSYHLFDSLLLMAVCDTIFHLKMASMMANFHSYGLRF